MARGFDYDYNLNQQQEKAYDSSRFQNPVPSTQYADAGCAAQTVRPLSTDETVDKIFTYQSARFEQLPKYEAIREAAKYFAKVILKNTQYGVDRQIAIMKLREAVMSANASIALDGTSL